MSESAEQTKKSDGGTRREGLARGLAARLAIELAIAVPRGRSAGLHYLKSFVEEVKASRRVAAALDRLGDHDASRRSLDS